MMFFIVIFLLIQNFYIFASDDDAPVETVAAQYQSNSSTKSILVQRLQAEVNALQTEAIGDHMVGSVQLEAIVLKMLREYGCVKLESLEHETVGASPAYAGSSDDLRVKSAIRSAMFVQENPQLEIFYQEKLEFVQKKKPELLPYFDRDILSLLACQLDKTSSIRVEDKNLFEIYLWKLFLDTYNESFKKIYDTLIFVLIKNRSDRIIPCEIVLNENDIYKKFVKKALSECLSEDLLEYTTNVNSQGITSVVLSTKSKDSFRDKITNYANEYIHFKIREYHNSYRPYAADKVPAWVCEYIEKIQEKFYKQPNFLKGLYIPTIFNRIGYDLSEINNMNKNKLVDQLGLINVQDELSQGIALSFFYQSFYTEIFENLYKDLSSFKKKYSIDLEDEKIFLSIANAFENFEHNIFHLDQMGGLRPTREFALFLLNNTIGDINSQIKKLKETNSQRYAHVPEYTVTTVGLENSSQSIRYSREQSLRELEKNALAAERYQQEQARLALQSQEHDKKQQEKKEREEKAAANKIAKEQAEIEKQKQAERDEAERRNREQERKRARDAAIQELYRQRDIKLENLRKEMIFVSDLEEKVSRSSFSSEIKKKLADLKAEIENQRKRLNSSKDLKKELTLFESIFSEIAQRIKQIEEAIEKEKKLNPQSFDLKEEQVVVDAQEEEIVLADSGVKKRADIVHRRLVSLPFKSLTIGTKKTEDYTPIDTQNLLRHQYENQFGPDASVWPLSKAAAVFYPAICAMKQEAQQRG